MKMSNEIDISMQDLRNERPTQVLLDKAERLFNALEQTQHAMENNQDSDFLEFSEMLCEITIYSLRDLGGFDTNPDSDTYRQWVGDKAITL